MEYAVYAKRTVGIFDTASKKIFGPDKTFMPIDEKGLRVSKAKLTNTFATKEDAQEWIDTHNFKEGVKVEVRKL